VIHRKPRPSLAPAFLSLLLVALSATAPGWGQNAEEKAQIVDVTLVRNAGVLQAGFRLDNAVDEVLLARIDSGLPTSLTFQVRLERPRKWWFDGGLGRSELQVIAMYNAVTREYLVNFKQDGSLVDSRVVQSRDALVRTMTQIDGMSLASFDAPSEANPVVRIRAALGSKNWLGIVPTTVHTSWSTIALAEATSVPPSSDSEARPSTLL
jgi:hypothetical protein